MRMKKAMSWILPLMLIILIGSLPFLLKPLKDGDYNGMHVDKIAPPFSLHGTDNELVRLSDFSDNYIIMMFGFTSCGHVCPVLLGKLITMNNFLKNEDVIFMFITIDPETDTNDRLKAHIETHGRNFIALRPKTFQDAQNLALKYNDYVRQEKEVKINHNGFIYLILPNNKLKLIYESTTDPFGIINDYSLLKQIEQERRGIRL